MLSSSNNSQLFCLNSEDLLLAKNACVVSYNNKPTGLITASNSSDTLHKLKHNDIAGCNTMTVAAGSSMPMKKKENKETRLIETTRETLSIKTRYEHLETFDGFKYPWGVAVNRVNGDVAIAEWGGNRVTIIDSQGRRKVSIGAKDRNKICLQNPRGVAFTDDNHLLITESTRILKCTQQGKIVTSVGGKMGSNQQQFDLPAGLSIHPHNRMIYIADSNNHRIQVLNQDLTFHSQFGGKGTERGKFYLPWDLSFDSKGMVYVAEGNCRVQKFTPEGRFVTAFGRKGNKASEISRPASITVDKNDIIHLTDLYNNRVSMFDTSGEFICCHGNESNANFNGPCGIAVATDDSIVYVSDCWNNRIKKLKYIDNTI